MKYQVFRGTYPLPEGTMYHAYGVCWTGGRIEDLSCSQQAVQAFAQALNEGGAEPCHVQGLAEDFLAGGIVANFGGCATIKGTN